MPGSSAPPVRRIEPDASGPGGWVLQGERMTVSGDDIWPAIRTRLLADPDGACLKCGDEILNCAQVQGEVEHIARSLVGRRVGVHVPRSTASVLAILAIWRNGGAYVPLATDYPLTRVQAIAQSCSLDVVVSDRPLELAGYGRARALGGERKLFVQVRDMPAMPAPNGRRLCYIAHTSGSSGAPKSVEVLHTNLLNRIACMRRLLDIKPSDRVLYKTSPVFDVHVWEFTLPLVAGCLTVIMPQTRMFDLADAARIMVADAITVVGFVPVLLRLLLDMPGFVAGNALRAVLCGGEAWGPALARDFQARLPGCRLYNSYGPAETTIAVANWPVPNIHNLNSIDLGEPLPNTVFFIEEGPSTVAADAEVVGALCIGGAQVALGYVGGGGSDRFFTREIAGEIMRFYATGDLVRLDRNSGSLRFKGRQDNQVKVNGMRIELEEIEEVVCGIDEVEDCVAFVADPGQFSQLCLAYKTRGNIEVQTAEIRRACARLLPAMLVPSRLKQVARLPLTGSGKVDRAALIAGIGQ